MINNLSKTICVNYKQTKVIYPLSITQTYIQSACRQNLQLVKSSEHRSINQQALFQVSADQSKNKIPRKPNLYISHQKVHQMHTCLVLKGFNVVQIGIIKVEVNPL